jgi:hypothetical protein
LAIEFSGDAGIPVILDLTEFFGEIDFG